VDSAALLFVTGVGVGATKDVELVARATGHLYDVRVRTSAPRTQSPCEQRSDFDHPRVRLLRLCWLFRKSGRAGSCSPTAHDSLVLLLPRFRSNCGTRPGKDRPRMERLLWICLAGACGTGTRYLVGLWATGRFGTALPYGTFVVNVVGCFFIALVMQVALSLPSFPANLRLALTTGFMGGLTTYSSFNYETTKLLRDGATGQALLNLGATVLTCFAAGWLGLTLVRRVLGS
jgi:CrcB protein